MKIYKNTQSIELYRWKLGAIKWYRIFNKRISVNKGQILYNLLFNINLF